MGGGWWWPETTWRRGGVAVCTLKLETLSDHSLTHHRASEQRHPQSPQSATPSRPHSQHTSRMNRIIAVCRNISGGLQRKPICCPSFVILRCREAVSPQIRIGTVSGILDTDAVSTARGRTVMLSCIRNTLWTMHVTARRREHGKS